MTEQKENDFDCTDCLHYAVCYLRRHRANKEDVTPCESIELNPWNKE